MISYQSLLLSTIVLNDKTKFDALLNVMKDCNNETVKKFGETISYMLRTYIHLLIKQVR